jgi:hypothetical protein
MTDERIVQRLQEELVNTHAENHALRKRVVEVEEIEGKQKQHKTMVEAHLHEIENAYAKQKAAEDAAAAARRKQEAAEHEALRARGELEELQKRFEIVKREADALSDLNARVEKARHVGDLFPAS